MVNNFEQISKLLTFEQPTDFYYVAILRRKSDGHEDATKSVKVVEQYAIYKGDLERRKDEIIADCEKYQARAYIYINRRDASKVAVRTARLILEYIETGDYAAVRNAYWKSVGRKHDSGKDKLWIVDIDEKDIVLTDEVHDDITNIAPVGNKVVDMITTKNGYHLITKPFNLEIFRETYPDIDVHKDNPTILYIPNI